MARSRIESLPAETLLQICELLRDNYTECIHSFTLARRHIPAASIYSFSETCKSVRQIANIVIFRNVILPIRSLDSVEEDVQRLCDALESASALNHIHKLRLCDAWKPPETNQKIGRGCPHFLSSDMAPAEDAWIHDHAWKPVARLLQRCTALTDLRYELSHQLSPCLLDALHQYRPVCRLHLRTFCAKTLLQPEQDKHELAIVSSPCLHSIWFRYMDAEEDEDAQYSQQVVQQVLVSLAPNLEEIRSLRAKLVHGQSHNSLVPQGANLMLFDQGQYSRSTRLKRLSVSNSRHGGCVLTKKELEGWHTHVDFSCLQALVLTLPLVPGALRWLIKCNLTSLKNLTFQLHDHNDRENEQAMHLAREFVTGLPPLSRLDIADLWRMLPSCLHAILLRHGATLRTLRIRPRNGIAVRTATRMLKSAQSLCPQLTELSLHILRDQGSIKETRLYKSFAGFPALRCLHLNLVAGGGLASRYTLGEERVIIPTRQIRYDDFDQQIFEGVTGNHNPCYGDIRRAFINKAIDEDFFKTVYHLACAPNRHRSIKEFVLTSDAYFFIDARRAKSPLQEVFSHICRSWTVQPGIRDDMPDELVVREMDIPRELNVEPAPEKLDPRIEQIFRRIWPGNEGRTSDWRTDWHSFLACDGEAEEHKNPQAGQF